MAGEAGLPPFYVELARQAEGPLVELAVGNGRVAIPVAKVTGRPVIGVDSSPAMLEQARYRADEAGVELDLREGDMRDFAIEQPAALIYCPFRALLHLPTWADRRRTFERVAASLRPGGRFAWNAFAFDHRIAARLDGLHQDEPVSHTIRYAVGDNRIDIALDDGAKSSLWWATKNEWLGLLDVARLELEALHGGFAWEVDMVTRKARVLGPHEGNAGWLGAIGVRFMIDAADSGANFSLVEHPMPPRALAAPLHKHHREDEYSFVVEGLVGAEADGEVIYAKPGDLIFKPRDQWHTFWNAGDEPARILEIISPAGFEQFFEELTRIAEPDPETIGQLAARYGLEMDFASMPRLLSQYDVHFPGAPTGPPPTT